MHRPFVHLISYNEEQEPKSSSFTCSVRPIGAFGRVCKQFLTLLAYLKLNAQKCVFIRFWKAEACMHKIAAIYDIHGNLPALEAVLQEIEREQPDLILVGGDVASGPLPRQTLERLIALGDHARFVRGNADRDLVNHFDSQSSGSQLPKEGSLHNGWVASQLDLRHRDFLASFEEQFVLTIEGLGTVLFCHGSPRSDEEILTAATPDERLNLILADVSQEIVVCGHTHMQFDLHHGRIRLINVGSVGMPYEGRPGAYWALLGPTVELRRTAYDFQQAASLVRRSGYPDAEEFASENILNPPIVAEATAIFERKASQQGVDTPE
jgi:putative phosphoesterase